MEPDVKLLFGVLGGGSISGASGKEIAKSISRIVYQIEQKKVSHIKFSPEEQSLKKMHTTIANYIEEGNRKKAYVVKVSKIDTSKALDGFKKDLEKVVNAISINKGVDISVSTKDFGTIAGNAQKTADSINDATEKITAFRAQTTRLDGVAKGLKSVFNSVNSNSVDITKKAQLTKFRDQYQEIVRLIEIAKVGQILLSDEDQKKLDKIIASFEKKAKVLLENAAASREAAKAAKIAAEAAKREEEANKKRQKKESEVADLKSILDLQKKINTLLSQNPKLERSGLGDILSSYNAQLAQAIAGTKTLSKQDLKRLKISISEIESKMRETGLSGKTLIDVIKEGYKRFGTWDLVTKSFSLFKRTLKEMVQVVIDLDSAMTELKKVTNETGQAYDAFLSSATVRAQRMGATIVDTVSATADFARLGYDLEESSSLADAAIVYKNVGDGIEDIGDASESIISTIKAFEKFGITAGDAMGVVDKFNEVGNNFAISSKGIGDGLLNSAAALAAAGNNLDESIAMITAANEVIQDPEHVGTTLKTVSMFLRAAKTEAEEAGESTEGMANSVSELRNEILALTNNKVDIQIDENTFKNTFQILKELSEEWGNLSDITRANLLEMIGGKRNANVVAALLENFSAAEDVLETSVDSVGSALIENEKYLESINGKIAKLKASFQALSNTVVNSEIIKIGVDAGTLLVDSLEAIVDFLGTIPTLAIAASAALTRMNTFSPLSPFKIEYDPSKSGVNIFKNMGLTSQRKIDIDALTAYQKAMTGIVRGSEEAEDILKKTMSSASSKTIEYAKALDVASINNKELVSGLKSYRRATTLATIGTTLLNAAISAGIGLITGFLVTAIEKAIHYYRDLSEQMMEDVSSYKEATDTLSEYGKEIDALKTKLATENLSLEESSEVRRRLLEIQQDVTTAYGLEADQLDLLTMSANEATAALRGLSAEMANQKLNENASIIDKAIKELEKERTYLSFGWAADTRDSAQVSASEALKNIFEKYSDLTNWSYETGSAGISLDSDDIFKSRDTINAIAREVRALKNEYLKFGINIDDLLYEDGETFASYFEKALNDIEETLSKNNYGEVYENAVLWKIADNSVYDEAYRNIIDFQNKYNDALSKTEGTADDKKAILQNFADQYNKIIDTISNPDNFNAEDTGVQRYLQDMVSWIDTAHKQIAAQDSLDNYLKRLNGRGSDEQGLSASYNLLREAAIAAGYSEEELAAAIERGTFALQDQSVAIQDNTDDVTTLVEQINTLATLQGNIDKLSAALGEFYSEGEISISTLDGLSEIFGGLSSFDNLVSVLSNGKSTFSDVEEALTSLGEEYLNNSEVLGNLTEENKAATTTYLKKMGVVNASKVVNNYYAKSEYDAAIASGELTDSTWDQIEGFLVATGASQALIEEIKKLKLSEYEAQLKSVDFSDANTDVFNSLLKTAAAAKLSRKETEALVKAREIYRLYEEEMIDKHDGHIAKEYIKELEELEKEASTGWDANYKLKLELDLDIDLPEGLDSFEDSLDDKLEDKLEKEVQELQTKFDDKISVFEHTILLKEKADADSSEIIKIYQQMQDAAHTQANIYRDMGLDENSKYIQALQKQWWGFQDEIDSILKEEQDRADQAREDELTKLDSDLNDLLADYEHEIFLAEKHEASASTIIGIYQKMQEAVHTQAETYRRMGYDEESDYIQALQKRWWEYQDSITQARQTEFENFKTDKEFSISEMIRTGESPDKIIGAWDDILDAINDEIKYYTSVGYDTTSEVLQTLINDAWEVKDEITTAIVSIVEDANESLDGLQNVYSTITDAAKEFASTGYLSVDSFQSILDLGPKYLTFLQDENGQLVLNEEALQKVIAAKTEDLAVETAMAHAKQVLVATENGDIAALEKLTQITISQTGATWDLVYATLNLARAQGEIKGYSSEYYDNAKKSIDNIRKLSRVTVNSVSAYYKTLDSDYISQKDALQTILSMTQDMIKWENEQYIKTLEDEKDAYKDIVDAKKESLQLSKKQDDHEADVAEKLKKIAKLQNQIDLLSLDDSREAKAKKEKLEEELYELQKSLADEQAEYSLEIQLDALDKQQEAFEDSKDEEIKAAEETINSEEKLYRLAIERIGTDWDGLYDDLLDWNYKYGTTLEKDLVNAWDAASLAVQRYGTFVSALESVDGYTSVGGAVSSPAAQNIISQMKTNSLNWFTAKDKGAQSDISSEQQDLADQLSEVTGMSVTSKNGSWYINNEKLYTLPQETVAKHIVKQMKLNSAMWHSSDAAEQLELSEMNKILAKRLEDFLGRKITITPGGVWMLGNEELYSIYHKGGIAGDIGNIKKNEVMALLEKGELVLDENREKALYRIVDFTKVLSDKLGKTINSDMLKGLFAPQLVLPKLAEGGELTEPRGAFNFSPNVSVYIQNTGNMNESDARRFGSIAADSVIKELNEAFTRRGINNIGNAILR